MCGLAVSQGLPHRVQVGRQPHLEFYSSVQVDFCSGTEGRSSYLWGLQSGLGNAAQLALMERQEPLEQRAREGHREQSV